MHKRLHNHRFRTWAKQFRAWHKNYSDCFRCNCNFCMTGKIQISMLSYRYILLLLLILLLPAYTEVSNFLLCTLLRKNKQQNIFLWDLHQSVFLVHFSWRIYETRYKKNKNLCSRKILVVRLSCIRSTDTRYPFIARFVKNKLYLFSNLWSLLPALKLSSLSNYCAK